MGEGALQRKEDDIYLFSFVMSLDVSMMWPVFSQCPGFLLAFPTLVVTCHFGDSYLPVPGHALQHDLTVAREGRTFSC